MSYTLKGGKLIRREKLRRAEPKREQIKTSYHHELWHSGPVSRTARLLAKQDFEKQLRRKGVNLNEVTDKVMDNGITLLLFNSGEYYLNKAKEFLR